MAVFVRIVALLALGVVSALSFEHSLAQSVQFAADFYTAVRDELPKENLIMSPLSVRSALGLLLMGAQGKTANELVRGLHLPTYERSEIGSYFEELTSRYNGDLMKVANKLFVNAQYSFKPSFMEVVRKSFKSESQNLDFDDASEAANIINSWVQDMTNGKIEKLFDANSFDANTRMVIANAVYFKGVWKYEFKKSSTRKDTFWLNKSDKVQVDMMSTRMTVRNGYIRDLDATIVMIPYSSSDLSMMVVVPSSRDGLSDLERKMHAFDFSRMDTKLFESTVDLYFPKFEIEGSIELPDVLEKMGMSTLFSIDANFNNMFNSNEPVSVDSGVHKAYIKVNEEGTEAAASTGFHGHHGIPSIEFTPEIRVDRPFFFAIVSSHDVAFVGSLRKP